MRNMARSAGLAVAAVMLIGAAAEDKPAEPASVSMSAAQAVASRRAAFFLSAATFGGMKGAITRGEDVKSQRFAAAALARWAAAIPAAFPAGSNVRDTRALSSVWSDRAGFAARAADYQTAARGLVAAAEAGDAKAFSAAWDKTRATCTSCHDKYRQPDG